MKPLKVSLNKLWINDAYKISHFLAKRNIDIIFTYTCEWNHYILCYRANLSNDYFTNRQDRYVLIEDCGPLADFYDGLVSRVSEFSLQLSKGGQVQLHSNWKCHPYKGKREEFESAARDRVWGLYQSATSQQQNFGKSVIIIW